MNYINYEIHLVNGETVRIMENDECDELELLEQFAEVPPNGVLEYIVDDDKYISIPVRNIMYIMVAPAAGV